MLKDRWPIVLALATVGLMVSAAGSQTPPRKAPTTQPAVRAVPAARGPAVPPPTPEAAGQPGVVQCANLIYGQNQTSVCFSDEFLGQIQKETHIRTNRRFFPVKLDSAELVRYPFAVMTGEGAFVLSSAQRDNLRDYLSRGGFLVASPGCSNPQWAASFRAEITKVFPEVKLQKLELSHPVFHTVYDVTELKTSHRGKVAEIEALELDGKIVLIFSTDGLNDTGAAGPGCCCCGGNEIINARQINVNLLAYALTR